MVLGKHLGFCWYSSLRMPCATWAEVRANRTGGQGQQGLRPEPTGLCRASAKSWGPRSTGPEAGPNQKPKNQKNNPPLTNTTARCDGFGKAPWFFGFLVFESQNALCYVGGGQGQQDQRPRSTGPEARTNKAVWGQGQKLGARVHRTGDRANP